MLSLVGMTLVDGFSICISTTIATVIMATQTTSTKAKPAFFGPLCLPNHMEAHGIGFDGGPHKTHKTKYFTHNT